MKRTALLFVLLAAPAFADDAADLDRAHTICSAHQQTTAPGGSLGGSGMWESGWEKCGAVLDRWYASERGKAAAAKKAAEENDKAFINGVAK